jgi:hypothetical protein
MGKADHEYAGKSIQVAFQDLAASDAPRDGGFGGHDHKSPSSQAFIACFALAER